MSFNDVDAAKLILNLTNQKIKVLDSNDILTNGSKVSIKYKMISDDRLTYYKWFTGTVERYYKSSKIYRIRFEDNSKINIKLDLDKENDSWVRI
tara:strand:- start:53 stop:334 length:282 start_codon:yes stop_codon:yes gene_type:complete